MLPLSVLIWATSLGASVPATPPTHSSVAVLCGRLIDGVSDQVRINVLVLISDGRIVEVRAGRRTPPDATFVDLSSFTVLPGLIDMHVHLLDTPEQFAEPKSQIARSRSQALKEGREHALTTLMAGFTTVRNLGTYQAGADIDLREEIASGATPGPRLAVSAFYLTTPLGGGDVVVDGVPQDKIPADLRQGVARGPAQFAEKARRGIALGVDWLKVIASGAVLAHGSEPGAPEMTQQEIAAVVRVAHAAGKKVAAHAHGTRSILESLRAGVDTVEHASLIDAEGIALAKRIGAALSMDVYNGDYIDEGGRKSGWPEDFLAKNSAITQKQRDNFTAAYRGGATIVFGTDAGVFPHGLNARQFKIMTRLGMKPMEAIRSATSSAAQVLGLSKDVGAIAPGRYGDMIAVRADPLADIAALENVEVVIKGGRVVKKAALK